MADDDIIIYNFSAMESAINSFNTNAKKIIGLADDLAKVTGEIDKGVQSDAGNVYSDKVKSLKEAFQKAEENLRTKGITELEQKLELGRAANSAAKNLAESVNTFKME